MHQIPIMLSKWSLVIIAIDPRFFLKLASKLNLIRHGEGFDPGLRYSRNKGFIEIWNTILQVWNFPTKDLIISQFSVRSLSDRDRQYKVFFVSQIKNKRINHKSSHLRKLPRLIPPYQAIHIACNISHLIKRCSTVLASLLCNGQTLVIFWLNFVRSLLTAKALDPIFHRNNLYLSCNFTYHVNFHNVKHSKCIFKVSLNIYSSLLQICTTSAYTNKG